MRNMVNSQIVFYILCITLLSLQSEAYDSAIKNKTIKQVTIHVSSFFSYDEYSPIADVVADCIYKGQSWDVMRGMVATQAKNISPTKIAQISMYAAKFAAAKFFQNSITQFSDAYTVLFNNVTPFYSQALKVIKKKKASGMSQNGCYKNTYSMASQWCTHNRIQLILQRVKDKLGSDRWRTFTSNDYFGNIFNFNKYNLK